MMPAAPGKRYKIYAGFNGLGPFIGNRYDDSTHLAQDEEVYKCADLDPVLTEAKEALKAMVDTWDTYLSSPNGYPAYQRARALLHALEGRGK